MSAASYRAPRPDCTRCDKPLRSKRSTRPYNGGRAHLRCVTGLYPKGSESAGPKARESLRAGAVDPTIGPASLRGAALASAEQIRTRETWGSHGWAAHRGEDDPEAATLAGGLKTIAWSPLLDRLWMDLHGGGQTLERAALAPPAAAQLDPLLKQAEAIGRARLRSVGVVEGAFSCVDAQLIRCERGTGKQRPHYDETDRAVAQQCITFLLYCTEGPSAAVPLQCRAYAARALLLSPCSATPLLSETAQAERVASSLTLRALQFTPGSSMLLTQDTLHNGEDALEGGKVALYLKFQPHDWATSSAPAGDQMYLRVPGGPSATPASKAAPFSAASEPMADSD